MGLIPFVNQQYVDANGVPLSGGTLEFDVSGTSTDKAVFSDTALSSSLGATVTLNSLGFPSSSGNTVLLFGSGTYRVTAKDSGGSTLAGFPLDGLDAGPGVGESDAIWLGTVSGTDTLTATPSPALAAYAAGQKFRGIIANNNTTTVTLNVSSLGALALNQRGTGLAANSLVAGEVFECVHDGTDLELLTPPNKATVAETRAATTGIKAVTTDLLETACAAVALTDAATVAVDWDTGIVFTLEITTNRTLGNPSNGQPGTWRHIFVDSDAGPDTLAFGTQYGGVTPTLTDITNTKQYLVSIFCVTTSHFVAFAADASAP